MSFHQFLLLAHAEELQRVFLRHDVPRRAYAGVFLSGEACFLDYLASAVSIR